MGARWSSKDLQKSPTGTLIAKTRASKSAPTTSSPQPNKRNSVILGIDPSLRGTGIAVVRFCGGRPTLLFSTTIKTRGSVAEALAAIAQSIRHVCEQFQPDTAAIESTIFAQNHRTAITLGAARGAAVATLSLFSIPCTDIAPTRIKQAVVGTGRASKIQVIRMTQALLHLPAPLPSDEADAAAAALAL